MRGMIKSDELRNMKEVKDRRGRGRGSKSDPYPIVPRSSDHHG